MNPADREERIVAMGAIANEAEKLARSGADPLDVQTFTIGAREELARQSPNTENYRNAAVAAKKVKNLS